VIHFACGASGTSPLERLEVIGPDDQAPIYWEPEFSRGQLYNKGLFMLGYHGEVAYFADCVRTNTPPSKCGLEDALEITRVFEAFVQPAGRVVEL